MSAAPQILAFPKTPSCQTGFALFLLLNLVMFVRPADVLPALDGWPIYQTVIVACILASLPALQKCLTGKSLRAQPGMVSVLLLLACIILSNLYHGRMAMVIQGGIDFSKIEIYFLLLIALVNTPARLKTFLLLMVFFIVLLAGMSLLQYHHYINLEALAPCEQTEGYDDVTGERIILQRLQGPGIFSDPNDFSLAMVCGIMVSLHRIITVKEWSRRLVWLTPIAICGYAFMLTQSRGGMLALLAGVVVLAMARLGLGRTLPWAIVLLPLLLFAAGGRQANLDLNNDDDTAQARIHLWRDSMIELRNSPLTGIGYGHLVEVNGLVAHNSYVQCYAELGLIGGTLFVGAFYLAFRGLGAKAAQQAAAAGASRELLAWRGCILAIVAAYAVGLYSLTRCYSLMTYLVLGLACAFIWQLALAAPGTMASWNKKLFWRLILISAVVFTGLNIFIRLLVG